MEKPDRVRANEVFAILALLWPDAVPLLHYRNCFELLCAVVLSAQCADEQVNKATPGLFARWPDAYALAKAESGELEATIHSLGFFRTKARHLISAARIMAERYEGRPPETMEELLELPGVGRKTANLVLSACFGKPGIIVDTHVLRVCYRLGFGPLPESGTRPKLDSWQKADPGATERRIALLIEPDIWTRFSYAVNRHGKNTCKARAPDCDACPITGHCPRIGVSRRA